jgi:hypothetical protein
MAAAGIDRRTPPSAGHIPANRLSPMLKQTGGNGPAGSAIAFFRGSEPCLEQERLMFRYRSISMGFVLDGSPIVTTVTGTVDHFYHGLRTVPVRVEVTDSLCHHRMAI